MKFFADDLGLDTAKNALIEHGYGLEEVEDSRGVCYVTIWTQGCYDGVEGQVGGYIVGSLHRNPGIFATYTLTFEEHGNDRERMWNVLRTIAERKSIR